MRSPRHETKIQPQSRQSQAETEDLQSDSLSPLNQSLAHPVLLQCSSANPQRILQLQRQYGNRYVNRALQSVSSSGQAMPEAVQKKMETAFGTDFSNVRIHKGKAAEAIGAVAYTQGSNIHFARGEYDPTSQTGQKLLGHELTHVVQQRAGRVAVPQGKGVPINADPQLEVEADLQGIKAAQGKAVNVTGANTTVQGGTLNKPVQCSRISDWFWKWRLRNYTFAQEEPSPNKAEEEEPSLDKAEQEEFSPDKAEEEEFSPDKATEILPMSQKIKFDNKDMSFEEKKRDEDSDKFTEGYYRGTRKNSEGKVQDEQYPKRPKKHWRKWPGQDAWLEKLGKVETAIKKYTNNLDSGSLKVNEHRYNYHVYGAASFCRLCHNQNGDSEYQIKYQDSDKGLILVRWPEGFRHYVETHNVIPSQQFYDFVNEFEPDQNILPMNIILKKYSNNQPKTSIMSSV